MVADDTSDFQRDTLQALGIAPERCLAQSAFGETHVERLWFATPLGHSEHATTAPDIAKKMRAVFVEKLGSQANERKRRVFISRVNARYRRLLNENELTPKLKGLGFEVVRPEELTFAEQVRIFSECAIVLGQHGIRPDEHNFCARRLPGFGDSRAGRHPVPLLDHGLHAGTQL